VHRKVYGKMDLWVVNDEGKNVAMEQTCVGSRGERFEMGQVLRKDEEHHR
jgi:hypothetical protein